MKRGLLLVIAPIGVLLSGVAVRSHVKSEARKESEASKKREAVYDSTLRAYSQKFKPGLTRQEVEEQLRTKNTTYMQLCCLERSTSVADTVKIGEEGHPWYCSENYVYIAFEFAAAEPHNLPISAYGNDILKKVSIFRQLGGCL